jgi:hypothetical protein
VLPLLDADLDRVVAAWPGLKEAIRRAVLALIGAVSTTPAEKPAGRDAGHPREWLDSAR